MDIKEFKRQQPIQPKNPPYVQQQHLLLPPRAYQSGGDSQSSTQEQQSPNVRTFVFGDLQNSEKEMFIEFMIKNNVQFAFDQSEEMYVATVKISNKNEKSINNSKNESKMNSRRESRQEEDQQSNRGEDEEEENKAFESPRRIIQKKISAQGSKNIMSRGNTQSTSKVGSRLISGAIVGNPNLKQPVNTAKSPPRKSIAQQLTKPVTREGGPANYYYSRPVSAMNVQQKLQAYQSGSSRGSSKSPTGRQQLEQDPLLLPEFQSFITLIKIQNPSQFRIKKMSIQNLMKMIDDIYQYRHSENLHDSINAEVKPLFATVGEFMGFKFKQKKMLDQSVIDLLASLDYFKLHVAEVSLFFDFFIEKTYDTSDLTFYLFMRSHAERELNIHLNKMTSGDSRQIRIYSQKGIKLIGFIYQQVLGNDIQNWEQGMLDEISRSIFNEILLKEQSRSSLRILDDSVQLYFLLESVLQQFKNQRQGTNNSQSDHSNGSPRATQHQLMMSSVGGQSQQRSDYQRYERILNQVRGPNASMSYGENSVEQNSLPKIYLNEIHTASVSDSQIQGRNANISPETEERLLSYHKKNLIRDRIFKHIAGTKLNQVIAFLLQQFYQSSKSSSSQRSTDNSGSLSKEVLDMIKEEVRQVVAHKLAVLIDALLPDSLDESKEQDDRGPGIWEQYLSDENNIEHVITQYYAAEQIMEKAIANSELVLKSTNKLRDGDSPKRSMLSETPSQLSMIQMKDEDLDLMARLVLHDLDPIKKLIADTVTTVIQNSMRSNHVAIEELNLKVNQDYHSLDERYSQNTPTHKAGPLPRYIEQSNNHSIYSQNNTSSFNRQRGSHQVEINQMLQGQPSNNSSMTMTAKAANNPAGNCAYHSPKNSLKFYTNMSK